MAIQTNRQGLKLVEDSDLLKDAVKTLPNQNAELLEGRLNAIEDGTPAFSKRTLDLELTLPAGEGETYVEAGSTLYGVLESRLEECVRASVFGGEDGNVLDVVTGEGSGSPIHVLVDGSEVGCAVKVSKTYAAGIGGSGVMGYEFELDDPEPQNRYALNWATVGLYAGGMTLSRTGDAPEAGFFSRRWLDGEIAFKIDGFAEARALGEGVESWSAILDRPYVNPRAQKVPIRREPVPSNILMQNYPFACWTNGWKDMFMPHSGPLHWRGEAWDGEGTTEISANYISSCEMDEADLTGVLKAGARTAFGYTCHCAIDYSDEDIVPGGFRIPLPAPYFDMEGEAGGFEMYVNGRLFVGGSDTLDFLPGDRGSYGRPFSSLAHAVELSYLAQEQLEAGLRHFDLEICFVTTGEGPFRFTGACSVAEVPEQDVGGCSFTFDEMFLGVVDGREGVCYGYAPNYYDEWRYSSAYHELSEGAGPMVLDNERRFWDKRMDYRIVVPRGPLTDVSGQPALPRFEVFVPNLCKHDGSPFIKWGYGVSTMPVPIDEDNDVRFGAVDALGAIDPEWRHRNTFIVSCGILTGIPSLDFVNTDDLWLFDHGAISGAGVDDTFASMFRRVFASFLDTDRRRWNTEDYGWLSDMPLFEVYVRNSRPEFEG